MADFDLQFLGDKVLERKLNSLGRKAKTLITKAMRESAKRVRQAVSAAAPVDTGRLRAAMLTAPVRVLRGRGIAGVGIALPKRASLGIDAKDKGYYPAIIEYGRPGVAANPYIRGTVDRMANAEFILIGRKLGGDLESVAL